MALHFAWDQAKISFVTLADLAGLGASEGPANVWRVPERFDLLGGQGGPSSAAQTAGADRSGADYGSWLFFAVVLALAAFLVIPRRVKR